MKKFVILLFPVLFVFSGYTQNWVTYTDKANSFQIEFPGEPNVTHMKSGFGIDSTQIIQYFPSDYNKESTANSLTVMFLSNEIVKPDFNEAQQYEILKKYASITIQMVGKVLETDNILMAGYPGIFIKGEITQAVNKEPYPPVFVKACLVDKKLYLLRITCSAENKENPLIEKFFNSFKLIERN